MGFFDKKKRSEDDEQEEDGEVEPVEVIQAVEVKAPPPPPPASAPEEIEMSVPDSPVTKVMPPPPPPSSPPSEPLFGIEDAVQLMRQLPSRNVELVVQVVKKTLESVHVDVSRIIEGAIQKERGIEERIGALRKEIDGLEAQITAARKEIAQLEGEQREVSTVKERLTLAQKIEGEVPSTSVSDRPAGAEKKGSAPPPPPPKG